MFLKFSVQILTFLSISMQMNLNVHGSAGLQGSVLPQPIDMCFTHWPARCEVGINNCTYVLTKEGR